MSEVKRHDPINSDGTCGICVEDVDYGAYVEYADYAALEAERDTLRTANQRLEGEIKRLRDALATASDYLDGNQLSSIASGSTCHRKMRAALSTADGEVAE